MRDVKRWAINTPAANVWMVAYPRELYVPESWPPLYVKDEDYCVLAAESAEFKRRAEAAEAYKERHRNCVQDTAIALDHATERARVAEAALTAARAEAEKLRKDNGALQATIDALMLEYCPEEMTPEQLAEYERSQVRVSPEEEAAIMSGAGNGP